MILLLCHLLFTKVKILYFGFSIHLFYFIAITTLTCLSKPNTFNIIFTYKTQTSSSGSIGTSIIIIIIIIIIIVFSGYCSQLISPANIPASLIWHLQVWHGWLDIPPIFMTGWLAVFINIDIRHRRI